jgi:pimeloyl-ACP methyl ester carboxylesterase
MTRPRWIDVHAPAVQLKALAWGPPDGPIALCLHGFPDTAYGWRNFAPRLAESGHRRTCRTFPPARPARPSG